MQLTPVRVVDLVPADYVALAVRGILSDADTGRSMVRLSGNDIDFTREMISGALIPRIEKSIDPIADLRRELWGTRSAAHHTNWIYERLLQVHGEHQSVDYMIRLREIQQVLEKHLL